VQSCWKKLPSVERRIPFLSELILSFSAVTNSADTNQHADYNFDLSRQAAQQARLSRCIEVYGIGFTSLTPFNVALEGVLLVD